MVFKFNFYFLRKEVLYTKLKYSRVPQFDTSSGAVASLISGFYGFLVCERFGFELLDSGDFLFTVMYLVFLFFFTILFFKTVNTEFNLKFFLVNLIYSCKLN